MLVGLDLGGTHIDGAIIDHGNVVKTIKRSVDPQDLFTTIWTTLTQLLCDIDTTEIERINLSTTISTNAIVEQTTAPVALFLSSGPGIAYDFSNLKGEVFSLSGSIDHRGYSIKELQPEEILEGLQRCIKKQIVDCAIITKFSTRNFDHELTIKKMIEGDFKHITLGHTMSGTLNYPRRVYTSYLNAAVYTPFNAFATNMTRSLKREKIDSPVYILKADGGTMDIEKAREHPVETILSGPAASIYGLLALTEIEEDAIFLDVGGTTTDIFFLADGVPLFAPSGATISNYKTTVRSVFSHSIGLGGDSEIVVDKNSIVIGPRRRGNAYAYGGPVVTPTDAMICLGLIEGVTEKEYRRAVEGLSLISTAFNGTLEELSSHILTKMVGTIKETTETLLGSINSKPVYTIKELLHKKRVVPQSIYIIGGPAQILSRYLEKQYQLPCHVPPYWDVSNAIGAALATVTKEITLIADTSKGTLTVPEIGLCETVGSDFTLEKAKARVITLLGKSCGSLPTAEKEIIEESCFNMVRGFSTIGKNLRVKGQIKPTLVHPLKRSVHNES